MACKNILKSPVFTQQLLSLTKSRFLTRLSVNTLIVGKCVRWVNHSYTWYLTMVLGHRCRWTDTQHSCIVHCPTSVIIWLLTRLYASSVASVGCCNRHDCTNAHQVIYFAIDNLPLNSGNTPIRCFFYSACNEFPVERQMTVYLIAMGSDGTARVTGPVQNVPKLLSSAVFSNILRSM